MPNPDKFCSELREKLPRQDLPFIRETSVKLITQLSSASTDVDAIVHTIRRDQIFATRVLAIANSAYYCRSAEKITTVKKAILLIGHDIIRDVAIAAEFVELTHKGGAHKSPQLGRLLARAFVAAHQSTSVCDAIALRDSETLFTSALLESLGEVALSIHMPAVYEEIESTTRTQGVRYEEAHRQATGLAPHALTVLVASALQLPDELILAPPDWERASEWTPEGRPAAIVHLTNAWASNLFTTDSQLARDHFNEVVSLATMAVGLPAATLTMLLTTAFEKAVEFGIHMNLGYPYFAIEVPQVADTPRQKLLEVLAKCYARLHTYRAFEVAYRIYSLPI